MFPIKNFSDIKSLIKLSKKTEAPLSPRLVKVEAVCAMVMAITK